MNKFSGHGRAHGGLADHEAAGNAPGVATTPDAFGLEAYTGSSAGTVNREESKQTVEQVGRTQPDRQIELRWQTRLGEPVVGGPRVHDGQLIVTGRSGRVYGIDAIDGTEHWRSGSRIATTRPAADCGLAFVGSEDGLVRAFDTANGSVQWTTEIDGAIEAAPAVREGRIYATSDRGAVYVIDANRGDRHTAFGHGSRAVNSLAVGRETVLLGSAGGGLQARCTTDGRERWRCLPGKAVVAAPAIVEDRAYVATIDGICVLAIDRVTGAVRQRFEIGGAVWGKPVVTDDVIAVASQDGIVTAFDRETGTRRWRVELCGSAWSGPTVDDGRIYVADDVGRTYAFDASDGEQRWQFDADAAITTAPTVADGTVVVVTEAGTVYALAETGI